MRRRSEIVLALTCGCATTPAVPVAHPRAVPPGVAPMAFVSAALERDLPAFVDTLSTQGRDGYRRLRLGSEQMEGWLGPDALTRQRNTLVGIVPSANDRRWTAWRRWGGSTVAGWCARGVRVAERDGAEGFTTRTVVIDRLLVVGVRDGATWAAWTEGLVLEQGGWRLAPWVPHAASVEAPRRAHPDVDLWDCDLARRPATSAPPPGG